MFLNVGCNMRHRLLAQSHMHLRELHTLVSSSEPCKLHIYNVLVATCLTNALWIEAGAGGAS